MIAAIITLSLVILLYVKRNTLFKPTELRAIKKERNNILISVAIATILILALFLFQFNFTLKLL